MLAETEALLHLPAFNQAFAEAGLDLRWSPEVYAERLRIAGGSERIASELTAERLAALGLPDDAGTRTELSRRLHARKGELVARALRTSDLRPRPGVQRLCAQAATAGWGLAVASSGASSSVSAIVARVLAPELAARTTIVAGEAVAAKKPDPAVYLLACERLGVAPADAVAVEDSHAGVEAALGAGLTCVATPSELCTSDELRRADLVVASLGDPGEPMRVLSNPSGLRLGDRLDLDALERLFALRQRQP